MGVELSLEYRLVLSEATLNAFPGASVLGQRFVTGLHGGYLFGVYLASETSVLPPINKSGTPLDKRPLYFPLGVAFNPQSGLHPQIRTLFP